MDESLIGGVRVVVGDEVLDTSGQGPSGTNESGPHCVSAAEVSANQRKKERVMQLNPAEISELIKSRIEGLAASSRYP